MNNRFKLRAKRLDNNKFVYGYLCFIYVDNEKHCKIYSPDEVMSYDCYTETLGQCTGLKDKNGKLIYDNDFIRAINQDTKDKPDLQIGHIWVDEMGCRWIKFKTEELSWNDFCSLIDYDGTLTIEVIGNIHENADLLECKDD